MKTALYFVHVIKTGGNSVRQFFEKNKTGLTLESSGHDSFSEEFKRNLQTKYHDVVSLIVLRDPVDQLRSFYSYIKLRNTVPIYSTVKGRSFSEWVRSIPDFKNYYVRYLNMEGEYLPNETDNFREVDSSYEKAACALSKIDHIFGLPELTQRLNQLLRSYGERATFNVRANVSPKMTVSRDDAEYIRSIRADDYRLIRDFGVKVK